MIYAILIIGVYLSIVGFCFYLLRQLKEQAKYIQRHNERLIEYKRRIQIVTATLEKERDAKQSHIK